MKAQIESLPTIPPAVALCCPRAGVSTDLPPTSVLLLFAAVESALAFAATLLRSILKHSTYARP